MLKDNRRAAHAAPLGGRFSFNGDLMKLSSIYPLLAACVIAVPAMASAQGTKTSYVAHLVSMNSKASGGHAAGEATFTVTGDSLRITVRMHDVPAGMAHLQHFHGFTDGHQSVCPSKAADKNGDGVIDLKETEPFVGITMVPFTADPVSMEIVTDTYPKASDKGAYSYDKTVSLSALQTAFSAKYPGQALALEKRVVFVHGIPATATLPKSAASLGDIPAQVTIPIACGAIKRVK